MKKILCVITSLIMFLTVFISTIPAAADNIASGKCGDNLTWTLNSEGVLTISGTGKMTEKNSSCENWDYYKYKNEIKQVVFEEGITSVGDSAFGNQESSQAEFPNITKVTLPSTLENIGYYAFKQLNITSINLPEKLKRIGFDAFFGTDLTSVNLHEGLEMIGGTFNNCNSLKEVTIPKNMKYLNVGFAMGTSGNFPFSNCKAIEKVIIEGGGELGQRYGDPIPNALAESMFANCDSLKKVIIKGNVEYIANCTFSNCKSLTDIYFYSTELKTISRPYIGTTVNNLKSIDISNNPTFHIVKGSNTEETLKTSGYLTDENTVYFADLTSLEEAIKNAEAIKTDKYTDASVEVLTKAIADAKALLENENASQEDVDRAAEAIKKAINELKEKPKPTPTNSSTDPSKNPNSSQTKTEPTKPSTPTKATTDSGKQSAVKAMKQAKITKLTAKSKSKRINVTWKNTKKSITVSWKKVKKAKGYEVQVSAKKNFKKVIFKKYVNKTKLTIKSKKLKSKKTYFVRVRAYATYKGTNNKTVKVYSKWNKKLRKVKVK